MCCTQCASQQKPEGWQHHYNQELLCVVCFFHWSCQQQWKQCNNIQWRQRGWLAYIYNLLECSMRTMQHVAVLLRFVKSTVLTTCWTNSWLGQENQKRKPQNIKQDSWIALKELEAAKKYMFQFDTRDNITVMWKKFNYTDKNFQKKKGQLLLISWRNN